MWMWVSAPQRGDWIAEWRGVPALSARRIFGRSADRYRSQKGFAHADSEKLSQDSFGSYFRFPFNLAYFNNSRKNFQHDCPKSARSFVALLSEAFGVWRANAAAMSPKLFWRKA